MEDEIVLMRLEETEFDSFWDLKFEMGESSQTIVITDHEDED